MFLKRHFKATLIKISFRAYFCIETLRQCGKEMLSICVKFLFPTHLEIVFSNGFWASLVAQRLRRLPPMRETWVWSLGREDPLEKEMVTYSSILARRIPWREEPGRLPSRGSQSRTWLSDFTFTFSHCVSTSIHSERMTLQHEAGSLAQG